MIVYFSNVKDIGFHHHIMTQRTSAFEEAEFYYFPGFKILFVLPTNQELQIKTGL